MKFKRNISFLCGPTATVWLLLQANATQQMLMEAFK